MGQALSRYNVTQPSVSESDPNTTKTNNSSKTPNHGLLKKTSFVANDIVIDKEDYLTFKTLIRVIDLSDFQLLVVPDHIYTLENAETLNLSYTGRTF
jgi:hypothetical protein